MSTLKVPLKLESTHKNVVRFIVDNSKAKDGVFGQAEFQLPEDQLNDLDLEDGKVYNVELSFTEVTEDSDEEVDDTQA